MDLYKNKIQKMVSKNPFSALKEIGKLHYDLKIQKVNYDLQEAQLNKAQAKDEENDKIVFLENKLKKMHVRISTIMVKIMLATHWYDLEGDYSSFNKLHREEKLNIKEIIPVTKRYCGRMSSSTPLKLCIGRGCTIGHH
eukprot:3316026-Ditylum_brightwellii.AAC.1